MEDSDLLDAFGGGYDQPVDMDYWDDDGSQAFADLWERTRGGHDLSEFLPPEGEG